MMIIIYDDNDDNCYEEDAEEVQLFHWQRTNYYPTRTGMPSLARMVKRVE